MNRTIPPLTRFESMIARVARRWQRVIGLVLIFAFYAHPTSAAILPNFADSPIEKSTSSGSIERVFESPTEVNQTKSHTQETLNQPPIEKTVERPPELPIPSGANPAYPPNHTLDSDYHLVGAPPPNFDFSLPGYPVGVTPINWDISLASQIVGTPPTNSTFETGNFTGWVTSTVGVALKNGAPSNYYAELAQSGVITSSPFTVDPAAQQLQYEVGFLKTSSNFEIWALSGPGYTTETRIRNTPACSSCGWTTENVDIGDYTGQSIMLRFKRLSGTVGIDNIRTFTAIPGFQLKGKIERQVETDGNAYASLSTGAYLTSGVINVDASAQHIALRISGKGTGNDGYILYLLSGANFATSTQLSYSSTMVDQWTDLEYDVSPWVGQQIKLQVKRTGGTIGVDNVGLQSVFLPNWSINGKSSVDTEADGNRFVNVGGSGVLTSEPFTVDPNSQQVFFRYRHGGSTGQTFTIKLLTGANFANVITISSVNNNAANWTTVQFNLFDYLGQLVKIQLAPTSTSRFHFDDVLQMENILPGWQSTGAQYAIGVGEDQYGTYVTPVGTLNGLVLKSQMLDAGIINGPRTDYQYYSVSFDIGYSTGNYIQVLWINSQGNEFFLFQEASNTPTGFRTRYFGLDEGKLGVGRFKVILSNGGKLYSIADNMARRHLAEPFSFKVGQQIDTSTGSFGYQTTDMQVGSAYPLVFTRYYNGHSDRLGSMGYGWSHSYETRMEITQVGDAGVVFGSGKEVFFKKANNSDIFTPVDARIFDTLVKNGDGSYTYTTKQLQRYNFDAIGKMTSIRDPNDNSIDFTYDANGRLNIITAPGGITLTLGYFPNGQLASVSNALGTTITYNYDPANGVDLIQVAKPANGVESYSYDKHRLQQVIDPLNKQLFYNTFDLLHRVIQQTDALTKTISIAYGTPALGVTTVTDPEGNSAQYYFDGYQRTTDRVDPLGNTNSYIYDTVGNLKNISNPISGQWNFAYDGNGNLLEAQNPMQNEINFQYNPQHLPTQISDGNGNVTQVEYDNKGNITKSIDPYGKISTFVYDTGGRLLSQVNPLGHTTTNTYDNKGNLLTHTDANGAIWNYGYNVLGWRTTATDPLGNTTSFGHDPLGRVISETNSLGGQKLYVFDYVGHLLVGQDEIGRTTAWSYNPQGLIEARLDPNGETTGYFYDGNRNLIAVVDPMEYVTQYEYDDNNRLIRKHQPDGTLIQYGYDGEGRLLSKTDELGRVTSYTYDNAGRKTSMTEAVGTNVQRTYSYTYDGNGNLLSETDPLNRVTRYGYDKLNRMVAITDTAGFVTTYTFDDAGRKINDRDPLNRVNQYNYDNVGRMLSMVDPLNNITRYGYNALGSQTVITNALGFVQTSSYDILNRLTAYSDPAGNLTQVAYNAAGQMIQRTEPTGAVTQYGYNQMGQQTVITDTLNRVSSSVYDGNGRLTQRTDALGQTTQYAYDQKGRMTSMTNALGKTTHYQYDSAGNRTLMTDPLGHSSTTTYDALNRPIAQTNPTGQSTAMQYNAAGQLVQRTLPSNRKFYYEYDARGLLTSVRNDLNQSTFYEYDAAGQQTKVTDARGYATSFGYDALGRQTTITNALNNVASFAYDPLGRMTSLTNYNGSTITTTYNVFGSVVSQGDPLGRVQNNLYDQFGRLVTRSDARGVPVNYAYDTLNRLQSVTHPGGVDTYAYDALDRIASVTAPGGSTSYSYDLLSRVTQVATPQGAVSYGYNDIGQRTTMSLPGGRSLTYNYDNAGNLANITDWVSGQVSFGYDADGNLSSVTRPNGVNSSYGYDLAGRLTNINHQGAGGSLLNFNYTLDANGNRTALASNAGNESYTLDPLSRLSNVTYGNGDTASYSYDANGNRLSQSVTPAGGSASTTNYSYDNAGQLLSSGAITYTYDANGNLTASGGNSYNWDYDNRLSSANVGGIASSYGYDAFGVRTSAVISGLNSSYLWDRLAENPLLLDDGSHAYVYADGPLAQFDTSNNRQYLLTDALNSVRGVSDNTGGLVGTVNYDVFGGVRNQTGVSSALGFTGELYNPQTQLLHLRAREYAATLGRLLSVDTVSPNAHEAQGYNVYAYVANNPTTWVDPSGHQIAPTMDNGWLTDMTSQTGSMMIRSLQLFSLSAFGATMVAMGAKMGTLIGLSGGITAADMASGLAVFSALMIINNLIWMCLINKGSGCFITSTLYFLGEMMSTMASSCQAQFSERNGPVFSLNPSQQQELTDLQANCVKNPEPKEEKEEEENCKADTAYLRQRATDVWRWWTKGVFMAEINRTVAVLRAQKPDHSCVDIVGGGGKRDLSLEDTPLLANEELARLPGEHAEITTLEHALSKGYAPIAIGTSRNFCPPCQSKLSNKYKATNMGQDEATWN